MLTILYTQNLAGDFTLLPRLSTFMRTLKDDGRTLMLDLGGACDASVWHCQATAGRSAFIALDGMGYHGANIVGALSKTIAEKLAEQVTLRLCEGDSPVYVDDPSGIQIALTPNKKTALVDGILYLQSITKGQVGQVTLSTDPLTLTSSAIHTIPASTLPDATIAGVIDFITDEARFYQKRRGNV